MSLFSRILEKLGIGERSDAKPAVETHSTPSLAPATPSNGPAAPTAPPATASADHSAAPIGIVDVEAQLERRAAGSSQKLNWRTSIVDLLKLLDIESSLEARKALATELHCPPELMNDSAQMNVWLHKMVLAKIAVNGGKVPQSLLD